MMVYRIKINNELKEVTAKQLIDIEVPYVILEKRRL